MNKTILALLIGLSVFSVQSFAADAPSDIALPYDEDSKVSDTFDSFPVVPPRDPKVCGDIRQTERLIEDADTCDWSSGGKAVDFPAATPGMCPQAGKAPTDSSVCMGEVTCTSSEVVLTYPTVGCFSDSGSCRDAKRCIAAQTALNRKGNKCGGDF